MQRSSPVDIISAENNDNAGMIGHADPRPDRAPRRLSNCPSSVSSFSLDCRQICMYIPYTYKAKFVVHLLQNWPPVHYIHTHLLQSDCYKDKKSRSKMTKHYIVNAKQVF